MNDDLLDGACWGETYTARSRGVKDPKLLAHVARAGAWPEDFGRPISKIIIDFDSHLDRTPSGSYFIVRYVVGTGDWDPAFVDRPSSQGAGGASAFLANAPHDIGLLHLVTPAASVFPGIQPASITAPNSLEPYRTGPKKDLFLQVGYGVQRDGPPGQPSSLFIDYTRNQSLMPPKKATDGLFTLGGNPDNAIGYGGPCSGDSGSPILKNEVIVAVFAFAAGCQNQAGGPRVDAGPARDFLRSRGLVP
jgi:hypothetical protein